VLFSGDGEIRALNRDFRGKDVPTNVLAFPSGEDPKEEGVFLGELIVSCETVKREAEALGIEEGELLWFYLIHGTLHLLGYDHELGEAEAEAQERETERLAGLITCGL
jgi:rRNA maturation RNase YbeY